MKLSEVIIKNEKEGKAKTNHLIVRAKLRELVKNRPEEIVDLLSSQKIKASIVAPKAVLYSTLVKHLALNSELRAAVTGMLMKETSEYLNATGQGMTIAGAAMQALGGILSGIGRNQTLSTATPMDEATRAQIEAERQRQQEEEDRKRRTNLAIGITVGLLVIIGIVIALVHASKKKQLKGVVEVAKPSVSALNA